MLLTKLLQGFPRRSSADILELVDQLETVVAIKEAHEDVENGRTRPAREALEELRQKHGIPG